MDATASHRSPLQSARGLLLLSRPKQWVKNTFVLGPLLFSGSFLNIDLVVNALYAMLLFCVASSAAYVLNDYKDIEKDRLHPVKSKKRPLAAGIVSKRLALGYLAVLYGILVLHGALWFEVIAVIAGYMLLNVAYTFYLKNEPVMDIFTIATGFVLRVYAGAVAMDVPISSWMFVTTFCLALYLAAVKRRQELVQRGSSSRAVLNQYTQRLVERYAEMSATGAMVFYSLFVMTAKPELIITIPVVMFGLFRYWFIVEAKDGGESPTDSLFSDWQLPGCVLLWVGICLYTLWPSAG